MGKEVYHEQKTLNEGLNQFDLITEHLSNGIYFIQVSDENGKPLVISKFVKNK